MHTRYSGCCGARSSPSPRVSVVRRRDTLPPVLIGALTTCRELIPINGTGPTWARNVNLVVDRFQRQFEQRP
jgi:hypothetical protein